MKNTSLPKTPLKPGKYQHLHSLGWSLGPAQGVQMLIFDLFQQCFWKRGVVDVFAVICQCFCFSKIYKTETLSVVIVGGINIDISLASKLFVKYTPSSQRRLFHNFFDMLKRNTEFL